MLNSSYFVHNSVIGGQPPLLMSKPECIQLATCIYVWSIYAGFFIQHTASKCRNNSLTCQGVCRLACNCHFSSIGYIIRSPLTTHHHAPQNTLCHIGLQMLTHPLALTRFPISNSHLAIQSVKYGDLPS